MSPQQPFAIPVRINVSKTVDKTLGDYRTHIQQSILIQRLAELILREALRNDPFPDLLDTELTAVTDSRSAAVLHRPHKVVNLAARALVSHATGFVIQTRLADLNQAQRFVHILRHDLIREAQPGERLRETQDAEEGSRRDVREVLLAALVALLLLPHAHVRADHVLADVLGDGGPPAARLGDILPDFVRGEDDALSLRVPVVHVHVGDVLGELLVGFSIGCVEHEEEDVEAGEQRGRQVDVLDGGDARVVAAVERVGGREDRGARVEGGGDAGFGDGDGLLLHDFVDGRPVAVVHLVELVDAADAVVGEHQGAALEHHLVGHGVAHDRGGEADAAAAASGGVDAARGDFGDVLEELRFGDSRVAHEADVDVAADAHAVAHFFGHATDEKEEQGFFDVEMAIDLRGDGPPEIFVHLAGVSVLLYPAESFGVEDKIVVGSLVLVHPLRFQVCVCKETCADGFETGIRGREEYAANVDNISWVDLSGKRAMAMYSQGSGNVAHRHLISHLLNLDLLKWEKF